MAESLFTVQTPANTLANDGASTLGTLFTFAVPGTVDGIRWYAPSTVPTGLCQALFYQWTTNTTGTLLGQVAFNVTTPLAWNSVNFGAPIPVVSGGQRYVAAIFTPDNYVFTNFFFTSAGLTNGNLTAPQNDNVTPAQNGKFIQAGFPAFPTQMFRENCYFVDVLFTASAAPTAIAVNRAQETDVAFPITPTLAPLGVAINRATETDTAFPILPTPGPLAVGIGQASETNTAFPLTPAVGGVAIALGRAEEIDTARLITPLAGALSVSVGRAEETDTASPITPLTGALSVFIGRATETDTAFSVVPLVDQVVSIGRAEEFDTAYPILVRMSSGDTPFFSGPCSNWEPLWCGELSAAAQAATGDAVTLATEVLWQLTGQRFGLCEVTLRPCRNSCADGYGTLDDWWSGVGISPFLSGGGPRPWWSNGVWYNVCGGCTGGCSCTSLEEALLPTPTRDVVDVRLDGVVLNPSQYRVDENRKLVRTDGGVWPMCQDMALSDDQPGTWAITITVGEDVPVLGRRAVADLAAEFAKDCAGEECEVPYDVTSLTRQGVTLDFGNPNNQRVDPLVRLLSLRVVRLFLATYNPYGLQRRGKAYDVNAMPNPWKRVNTS